jgi:hypothetical protein
METALTYTLQRVRLTMFFALVRSLCRWHKVPFRKCVWALRQEPGEIGGRLHFHFLLAGLPSYAVQDKAIAGPMMLTTGGWPEITSPSLRF